MKKLLLIVFVLFANTVFTQTCKDYFISPNTSIPDNTTAYTEFLINVSDFGIIQDIDITLNITHTWNADLDILLESPIGTLIELSTDNGSSGNNYVNVLFNDSAQEKITNAGSSGISGTFRPEEAIIKVRGEDMNGNWKLLIRDDAGGDIGTLDDITLRICKIGYTGPGGVGDSETTVLWLRSEDISVANNSDISEWSDFSGRGNNLSQSDADYNPIYRDNQVNGYPLVEFSKDENRIRKTDFVDFPSTEITAIYVNKNDNESNDGILSYASSADDNDFLLYSSDALEIEIKGSKKTTTLDCNDNVWNIDYAAWKSAGGNIEFGKNGQFYTNTHNSDVNITNNGCFAIGNDQDGIDTYHSFLTSNDTHNGDFTEVIIYNTFINSSQQIIVSNYLSAKYNTNLSVNDIYVQDDVANGNFDFNVAGIGEFVSEKHVDSKGTGIVRINTPSSLTENDFLFWG